MVIAGRLREGHVVGRASKQKRRLLWFPGYYQYSNEIALIHKRGGIIVKRIQRALAHI